MTIAVDMGRKATKTNKQNHAALNWYPVVVSIRQQVSPILSLAVISLLIDQWGGLLRFKLSVGCKHCSTELNITIFC